MTRRTRNEIERTLLDGVKLAWQDGTNRRSIALDSSLARRLCAYLLTSGVRDAKGIPSTFLTGLVAAYNGTDDPAQIQAQTIPTTRVAGPWRLARIETQGFGGLNTWKGSSFAHDLREDSLLIDGPNGSGKSSFVAAIAWALTGDRPRDAIQVGSAHDRAAVFNPAGKAIGNWPPLACYPVDASSLSAQPDVRVKLTFRNPAGIEASAERSLSNGQVVAQFDPQLELPGTLIESGVLMPIRLSGIRFGAGEGLLLEAVQTLTGLDEIVVLGDFVSELCHKGREYLGYARAQGRDGVVANFDSAMQRATDALKPLSRTIQDFQPADTKDPKGSMATLGTELQESATRLLQVIRADLASTIDLTKIDDQRKVAVAIDRARRDVAEGLRGLPAFTIMSEIRESLTETRSTALTDAIGWARAQLQEAITLHEATLVDPRFRLKALAAAFHAEHSAGSIENCPLCEQSLQGNAVLAKELQRLQTAREAAQRTFRDNANAITKTLESSIPSGVLKWRDQIAKFTPKAHLVAGMTSRFITAEQYRDCLAGIAAAVEAELSNVPTDDLNAKPSGFIREDLDGSRAANEAIAMAEHIVEIAAWSRRNDEAWKQWWTNLAGSGQSPQSAVSLSAKLDRLDEAVKASAPYSAAAAELRVAWKLGRRVVEIDAEQQLRQAIADAISPLKELRNFAEVEVKNAIEGLSSRMSQLLEDIHIVERLQFRSAHLDKKAGVTVRGAFHEDLQIDATLVANTSWIRALLWAFIFSIREEAVEQAGEDRFPLLVLDDPQATFDATHRLKWAKHVAAMQTTPPGVQVVLATHDEAFLEELSVASVKGQAAFMVSAASEADCVALLIGSTVDRKWREAEQQGTPQAAQSYIAAARIYVEAILKAMVRGEIDTRRLVLGDLREKIRELHDAKIAPWNRSQFASLVAALDKGRAEIKHLESSHHASGRNLGIAEARAVNAHWTKVLFPRLEKCFRSAREHHLLHGGSKALYADPPTDPALPGHREAVRSIPLSLLGRASALTGGRAANGEVSMVELGMQERKQQVLGKHDAFRIVTSTLEPVARVGDILLVADDDAIPPGSLVVAVWEDRLLARRLQFASDHPDIAVLTAHATNPRENAAPVIAHVSTLLLRKIVGVLFDPMGFPRTVDAHEVADCGGAAAISNLMGGTLGLVEVAGDSAEPLALNGQFLLVSDPIDPMSAYRSLNGRPVIAADSDGHCYFKRLRVAAAGAVVLESLDAGGSHEPIFLEAPGESGNSLSRLWPVAGVLFELPN